MVHQVPLHTTTPEIRFTHYFRRDGCSRSRISRITRLAGLGHLERESSKRVVRDHTWFLIGLTLTFLLSTASGFLLGGNQPPAGQGLPIVGWHLYKDIRPSHFLGVHAQQLIPLLGLCTERFFGSYSTYGLGIGSALYVAAWGILTWTSFAT